MKYIILYTLLITIFFVNGSLGDTDTGNTIILDRADVFICAFFFLGTIVSFGLGGAHEWHLRIQDIRISEGSIKNTQRHQLLAGFKDRAAVWSGILGSLIAILTTQVEHFSQSISFPTIISGVLILCGPYLFGRLMYIFYLYGAEYRKEKTIANKNYLPFYFLNISLLVVIVNYFSVVEFTYILGGYIARPNMYLYYNLTTKILTALIATSIIDQTVFIINVINEIDKCPKGIARILPSLAKILGYIDMVETVDKIADKIDKNGKISITSSEDIDLIIGK